MMVQGLRIPTPNPRDFKSFGAWLEAATEMHGSKAELARRIGKSGQDVNGWIKEGKQPNSKTLAKVANYFGVPYIDLLVFWDQQVVRDSAVTTYFQGSRGEPVGVPTVPLKGAISPIKNGGFWMETDNKLDARGRVHYAKPTPQRYALRVLGDELFPRYRAGEFLILDPELEARPGDEVVVTMTDGRLAVLQLVSRRDGIVSCMRIGVDPKPASMRESEIASVVRVMGHAHPDDWIQAEPAK